MSEDVDGSDLDAEEYGSLSIEDDDEGTVDPAELAGTASPDDDPVGGQPAYSEADDDLS